MARSDNRAVGYVSLGDDGYGKDDRDPDDDDDDHVDVDVDV
jgi:hypothetical protein